MTPQLKLLNTRDQGTVTVEDGYVKKFMKAVGWMDQSRTVSRTIIKAVVCISCIKKQNFH